MTCKFKVGDKVRWNGGEEGIYAGTIVKISNDSLNRVTVVWDKPQIRTCVDEMGFVNECFELVRPRNEWKGDKR